MNVHNMKRILALLNVKMESKVDSLSLTEYLDIDACILESHCIQMKINFFIYRTDPFCI